MDNMRSRYVKVVINLDQVRASAERIRRTTGVDLIAVIKADAYGLGAGPVADTLATVAHEFAYFSIHEAREVRRPGITLGPPDADPAEYRELHVRPAVCNRAEAEHFRDIPTLLNVDTGMHWSGCSPDEVDDLLKCGCIDEAFTHVSNAAGAALLKEVCGGRVSRIHAAASTLVDCPEAWLDAVRPGLALYRGAVRVTAPLTAVRKANGKVGYSSVDARRIGVILAGYSNRLRPAPVLVNGRRQRILESGMNTSILSVDPADRVGDEVVLLGDELTEAELSQQLNVRPHEILCRYTAAGQREYVSGGVSGP